MCSPRDELGADTGSSRVESNMYYVYVLLQNNGNLYTGYSEDLKRRLHEHDRGKVASTREHLPLILLLYEAYKYKEDAERREKYLKSSDGKRDIKRQLSFAFRELNIHKKIGEVA